MTSNNKNSVSKDKKRNGKGAGTYDNLSMTGTGKKATGFHPKTAKGFKK